MESKSGTTWQGKKHPDITGCLLCAAEGFFATVAGKPSITLQILSERLKELRERHDLTQESLAQMCGIAYKYFQDIEGCRRGNLELVTLEKIAGVFGLEAYQLFATSLPPTKLKPLLKALAPHKRVHAGLISPKRVIKKQKGAEPTPPSKSRIA